MDSKILNFIKQRFRGYYERKPVIPPDEFEKREFGFGDDKKIDIRHFAFKSADELAKYFVQNAPLYASFSTAYYEFPDQRPMEKKNFLGADLIFEFDAECAHGNLACAECLEKMKNETIKLIENFLIPDFGFKKSEIQIVFSGSRGYHVYVKNENARKFSLEARRQIADYLQAKNPDLRKIIGVRGKDKVLHGGASLDSKGIRGRIVRAIYDYIKNSDSKRFKHKEKILEQLSQGNYDVFKGSESILDKIINEQIIHLSSNIDQSVTLDISRLIRMPSTLHGGSSLLCCYVPFSDFEKFNPFIDAVVFTDKKMNVRILGDTKEIVLREQAFGPFQKNQIAEVPEHAAMLLICRGAAMPIGT